MAAAQGGRPRRSSCCAAECSPGWRSMVAALPETNVVCAPRTRLRHPQALDGGAVFDRADCGYGGDHSPMASR